MDMCGLLNISRSYYYKVLKLKKVIKNTNNNCYDELITSIYDSSRGNYGSRKISRQLLKDNVELSRYKVLKRMKHLGLSSLYHKRSFKPYKCHKTDLNNYPNIVDQQFTSKVSKQILTSDVTYFKYKSGFAYVCFIVDLYNREIVSCSVGIKHDAQLVMNSLNQLNLDKVAIFHSDRGREFLNDKVRLMLDKYSVLHSLSKPGYPYDNAVSENLFGILKREWCSNKYTDILILTRDIEEFVTYYNNFRLHSKLNYQSPVEYRLKAL